MKKGKGKATKRAMKFAERKQKVEKWVAEYDGTLYGGADAVLAALLKSLIESEIVVRKSYDEVPPYVEYSLSEKSDSVVSIIQSICKWSGIFYKEDKGNMDAHCQRCDFHQ